MTREALAKLNEKQIGALNNYSALIARAKVNGLKEEFERNSGGLRGFLECLCNMEVITGRELQVLYIFFSNKDRSGRYQ